MLCASCTHCHFIVFFSGWQVSRRTQLVFMRKHLRHLRAELTWHKGSNCCSLLNDLRLDLFHHINIQISVNASLCTHTECLIGAFMLHWDEEIEGKHFARTFHNRLFSSKLTACKSKFGDGGLSDGLLILDGKLARKKDKGQWTMETRVTYGNNWISSPAYFNPIWPSLKQWSNSWAGYCLWKIQLDQTWWTSCSE